jgi:hypothetical protein
MDFVIPKERLNNILFPILDEVYGPLDNSMDESKYFDEYGMGRVHVRTRKKVGYVLYKDFQKLIEELPLPLYVWFNTFIDWFYERYNVKLDPDLSWLSYQL